MIPILSSVSWRSLLPGQVSRLTAINPQTRELRVILKFADAVIEAPNWSPDGRWIVYNSAGSLYRVAADGHGAPTVIDTGSAIDVNNDHLVSPDGATIYVSSERDGHLYAVPFDGGSSRRISPDVDGRFGYFALGLAADGAKLYFTGAEARGGRDFVSNLFSLDLATGEVIRFTDSDDDSIGCDPTPGGEWLYFNSDRGGDRGHSQVYRVRPDGSGVEQLTNDAFVNWFPKVSPQGDTVAYLSFPPGTQGHEANVRVWLRAMRLDGSGQRDLVSVFGGQGTMNVSSWAPDGSELAFVDYPVTAD